MVESASGAASASARKRSSDVGRGRQDEDAAGELRDVVQLEAQPRDDAEVAAAAADRPEQVGVPLGVDLQHPAVGGHDLGRQELVDRHPVLADEEADAAAERDAADADRAGVAEAGGEPVRAGGGGVLARGQAAAGPGGAAREVDVELAQAANVEHDAAVARGVAGGAVAAAADGQLGAAVTGERDDAGHVGRVGGAGDQRGAPVDVAQEDGARGVVARVLGREDAALDIARVWGDGEHRSRLPDGSGTMLPDTTRPGVRAAAPSPASPGSRQGTPNPTHC